MFSKRHTTYDSDSDDNRYRPSTASNSYGGYSRGGLSGGGGGGVGDRYNNTSSYRTSRNDRYNSDSDDNTNRYGANTRRVVKHSDSEDSDRYDRRRRGGLSARPGSSRRGDYDSDSYDSANQKLKMMMQMEKGLVEDLDELYEAKLAKEKKIEQLRDEIQRDTIKEDNLRKKLNDLRIKRKTLQNRLDEFK